MTTLRSLTIRVPSTTSHLPPVRVVPEIWATVASMARVAPFSTRTVPSFEKSPPLKVAVVIQDPVLTIVAPGRFVKSGGVPETKSVLTAPLIVIVP